MKLTEKTKADIRDAFRVNCNCGVPEEHLAHMLADHAIGLLENQRAEWFDGAKIRRGKALFWWVVRHRAGGYVGPYMDKHVERQSEAKRHFTRRKARFWSKWWDDNAHVVVRVWARGLTADQKAVLRAMGGEP